MNHIINFFIPSKNNGPIGIPFVSLMMRLVFASTLLLFFWSSAKTKFETPFQLSVGAYAQMFPRSFEAAGYDPSQLPNIMTLIGFAAGYSEFILPVLIIIGLFTRLAAFGMIGFILVMSWVDVFGHGVQAGLIFDKNPYDIIADQRMYWFACLATIFALGGGYLSLDRFLSKRQTNH